MNISTRIFYVFGTVSLLLGGCSAPVIDLPTSVPPTLSTPTSTSEPYEEAVTPSSMAETGPLTQTLTMDDYQYSMECNGVGNPTILLLGGRSATWETIQTELSTSTRTCVFEHAGSRSTPLTAEEIAKNVHTLLDNSRMSGPYVLVGFSVGGYIARLFAGLYPHEVAGVALLDSSHEDQHARLLEALPAESSDECQELKNYRLGLQGSHILPVGPDIKLDFDASAAEVRGIETDLGSLPLVVLTAGRSDWPNCFPQETRHQLDRAWLEMQNDFAGLSRNSTHLVATESNHSFAEQPERVIDAIKQIVQTVQNDAINAAP